MKITIKLETDNAAFAEDRNAEVIRIVQAIRWDDLIPEGKRTSFGENLRDINGNTVGTVEVRA